MNKIIIAFIVILLAFVGFMTLDQSNTNNQEEVIKIGVIVPLTGKGATWGENVRDSVELAYSELSEEDQKRFKILYEDDELDPAKTVGAYKKLKNVDNVHTFITVGSVSASAVAPLVEESRDIMFAITNDPAVTKDRKYTFKHFFLPETDSDALLEEVQRRGYEDISIFTTNYQGVIAIRDLFIEKKPSDLNVIDMGTFEPGLTDFRTDIAKVKKDDLDAIGLFMMPGQIGVITKQIREAGIEVPVFSIGTVEDKNELKAGGVAMEGMWFSAPAGPLDWYKENFSEVYGRDAGLFTGNAYDIANIYFDILARVSDSDEAVEEFNKIRGYKGAMGDDLSMDDANNISVGAVIKEIRDGKFVTISQ